MNKRYQVRVWYEGEPREDNLFESEHRFKFMAKLRAGRLDNLPAAYGHKARYFVRDTRS